MADRARPDAYIGLEHIPERAIRIEKVGNTEDGGAAQEQLFG
jgi:hypothetical protein